MMDWLGKVFGERPPEVQAPTRGDMAYDAAMSMSDNILEKMDENRLLSPAVEVFADIWAQKNNVPFMVTVIETVQEMKSPLEQSPEDTA